MAINKNYLQLEFSTGNLFQYSKEEKQGYEKHVSSKGNTSYRKYYTDGIAGVLESVGVFDGPFGQQLSLNVKDGDEVYLIQFNLYDQKSNVDTFVESIIKLLPNLSKGDDVIVNPYNFKPDGEKYAKIGVSIKKDGEKLKPALTNAYFKKDGTFVEGDIPAIKWKEDALGKKKPSASSLEEKDDFLISKLKEETERLKWVQGESNSQPKQQSSNKVPPASPQEAFEPADKNKSFISEEDDTLPF